MRPQAPVGAVPEEGVRSPGRASAGALRPVMTEAGFYESRDPDRPWAKTVALLRHEYGEHPLRGDTGTGS